MIINIMKIKIWLLHRKATELYLRLNEVSTRIGFRRRILFMRQMEEILDKADKEGLERIINNLLSKIKEVEARSKTKAKLNTMVEPGTARYYSD